MNFKQATDVLMAQTTLQDLADAMGVSLQAVRQARSEGSSLSYRQPPKGWEAAVAKLARTAASRLSKLADRLED